jgi:hypothetical protein
LSVPPLHAFARRRAPGGHLDASALYGGRCRDRRLLSPFSDRLTLEALEKGDGHVSEEMLRKHAEILFTFLEGEPNSKEHRVVRDETKLRAETVDHNEVAIYVGYDNGLVRRGYLFRFKKDVGRLLGTTAVFGD